MEFKEFIEFAREAMEEKTGLEMQIKHIRKNNCERVALVAVEKESNVSEAIYLEPYYSIHESGVGLEEIIDFIHEQYKRHRINEFIDISDVLCFSKIKDNIRFALIGYERNKDWLATMPHRKVLDMAVVYYYTIDSSASVFFRIQNEHMMQWGVSETELFETAMRYTPEKLPAVTRSIKQCILGKLLECLHDGLIRNDELKEIIANGVGKEPDEIELPEGENISMEEVEEYIIRMYEGTFDDTRINMAVLSNNGMQGAACMLYPHCLKKLAEDMGNDLYILPSSVHEVIMLPLRADTDFDELKDMVYQINRSQLAREEFLSDNVYLYRRDTDKVEIV